MKNENKNITRYYFVCNIYYLIFFVVFTDLWFFTIFIVRIFWYLYVICCFVILKIKFARSHSRYIRVLRTIQHIHIIFKWILPVPRLNQIYCYTFFCQSTHQLVKVTLLFHSLWHSNKLILFDAIYLNSRQIENLTSIHKISLSPLFHFYHIKNYIFTHHLFSCVALNTICI